MLRQRIEGNGRAVDLGCRFNILNVVTANATYQVQEMRRIWGVWHCAYCRFLAHPMFHRV
jgi:hypothetical protein